MQEISNADHGDVSIRCNNVKLALQLNADHKCSKYFIASLHTRICTKIFAYAFENEIIKDLMLDKIFHRFKVMCVFNTNYL